MLRKILIDAIIDLAGDEFETKEDVIMLAKFSDEELIHELVHIANYYRGNDGKES